MPNYLFPLTEFCMQKETKSDGGELEGQDVLCVRAYGSSFFTLGINIRLSSLYPCIWNAFHFMTIAIYGPDTRWLSFFFFWGVGGGGGCYKIGSEQA